MGEDNVLLNELTTPAVNNGDVVKIKTMAYLSSDLNGTDYPYQFVGFDEHGTYSGVGHSPLHS